MVRRQYTEEDSPYVPKGIKSAPAQYNQGLKSTPIYNPIHRMENAQRHIYIAMGMGLDEVIRIATDTKDSDALQIAYLGNIQQQQKCTKVFGVENVEIVSDIDELLNKCIELGTQAMMGDGYYVICPEMYIWKIHQIFTSASIERDTVQKMHIGTAKRRVYCCHCQTYEEDVVHDIYECSGCKQMIYAYDHFSRINASYLGFRVDAETPNEFPEPKEAYS